METENKKKILCSISTKGRYDTTLPMAILSVVFQTLPPDKLIIFDDNDTPVDIREIQHYEYILRMLYEKNIDWCVELGEKKGQHFNHQKAIEFAKKEGYDFIWRLDDDTVAEPDVLEKLYSQMKDDVGAVGGSILTPPFQKGIKATGKMENIKTEPNIQWDYIKETKEIDHLHCSFLYRVGVYDYDLALSKVAHREESIFSFGIKTKGYKVLVTPCITWHLRNKNGGIRDGQQQMFEHDEGIFNAFLNLHDVNTDKKLIVLDNGIGDHYSFKNIIPKLKLKHKRITLAVCFPDVFWDEEGLELISIDDAKKLFGDIGVFSVYHWMDKNNHKESLVKAFEKMYL